MAAYDNPGNIKHGMVGWFIVFNPMLSGKSQFKYFTPEDFEKYFERCQSSKKKGVPHVLTAYDFYWCCRDHCDSDYSKMNWLSDHFDEIVGVLLVLLILGFLFVVFSG